jgi:hypothetical protein
MMALIAPVDRLADDSYHCTRAADEYCELPFCDYGDLRG